MAVANLTRIPLIGEPFDKLRTSDANKPKENSRNSLICGIRVQESFHIAQVIFTDAVIILSTFHFWYTAFHR